jgi:Fur family transcriptional regulator, ferric uptake regulator
MSTTPAPRRSTRQREAVRTVLDDLDGFRSAQQIHAELGRRDDSVGLSTVYRTLASMATDGEIDSLLTDDGETVYRRCEGGTHHHHLVCRQCGATVEIDGPAVETWADRMAAEHGYDDVSHTLEIFGRCAACRA